MTEPIIDLAACYGNGEGCTFNRHPGSDTSHARKCWDCGNVAVHQDSIVPHVLCKKCGSQDTRRVKEKT